MVRLLVVVVLLLCAACGRHSERADYDARVAQLLESHFRWISAGQCAYDVLGADAFRLFVYYHCRAPDDSQGAAGEAVVHVDKSGRPHALSLPRDGSDYGADLSKLFPSDVLRILRSERNMVKVRERVAARLAR